MIAQRTTLLKISWPIRKIMVIDFKKRGTYVSIFFLKLLFLPSSLVAAYPGGPLQHITNAGPFCAICHAVSDAQCIRDLPPDKIPEQLIENKHYKAIAEGKGPYEQVSAEDRTQLLEDIKIVDANAKVTIQAPLSAKSGENIKVVIKAQGGFGVVGIMLVDTNLRNQASPLSVNGWEILEATQVIGPDGKPQTWWLDKRFSGLKKNINFILINGIKTNLAEKKFSEVSVIYSVKAPRTVGEYTLAAAFLYGTEKASRIGLKGGFLGPSGRILFSEVIRVTVE
jgi:hypothetical protein